MGSASVRGTTLTGTWALVRFILRRDRVRLAVWIIGITLLVLSTAASIDGLYPTQADLDKAAQTANDNAALIALNAPSYALDTLGDRSLMLADVRAQVVQLRLALSRALAIARRRAVSDRGPGAGTGGR